MRMGGGKKEADTFQLSLETERERERETRGRVAHAYNNNAARASLCAVLKTGT